MSIALRCLTRQPPSTGHAEVIWTALTYLARREGFTVERANCAGADGFTTWRNRRIRIRPDITSAQAVIALAHQLGHVLLHEEIAKLEPSGTPPCTGIRKVEADSVTYLIATLTGFDTTAITFPHPSSWAGSDPRAHPAATIKVVTARILTATTTVTAVLDNAGLTREQSARNATASNPARRTGGARRRDHSRPRQRRRVLPHPDAGQLGARLPGQPRPHP